MGNSFSKSTDEATSNVKLVVTKKRYFVYAGKNGGCKEEPKGAAEIHAQNGEDTRSLKVAPTDGEKIGSMHGNSSGSSSKDPSSSVTGSAVESNCSETNFSESSRSCSNGTSNSKNISEVQEDGGCVDDWEVLADELAATDDKVERCDPKSESLLEKRRVVKLDHLPEVVKLPISISPMDVLKPKIENRDESSQSLVENNNVSPLNHQAEVVKQSTAIVDGFKPKPKFGEEWRGCNAFQSKPKPGFGQAWKQRPEKPDPKCKSSVEDISVAQSDHLPKVVKEASAAMDCRKAKPGKGLAWRNNDTFRPKSLPNPRKKHTFPVKEDRHHGRGGTKSGNKNIASDPTPCPICSEDMDSTDLSFLPCSCGFQLCLFCHKRILEQHCGRCPGCREPYDNNAVKWEESSDKLGDCSTLRLARSC
ncbi:uncharacterized protein LOC135148011 [Daucus carota subsp. sativus]|uniref:uncharacterized protein LOC135148011 n=1 Tax=Daucus carota subsp. sativus TaxID=79200 RepID=UPI003083BE02